MDRTRTLKSSEWHFERPVLRDAEVRIFLDALDECCERDATSVLQHLIRLVSNKTFNVKLLLSTRDVSKRLHFVPEDKQALDA